MKIGIIGAGFIGRALALLGAQHGHDVMVSNSRGPHTLSSTVAAIGCKAGTAEQASAFGDVVILTVPFRNREEIAAAPLAGKIVVDTCNYYPMRDGQVPALDARATTTSEMIAAHLPGASVVKAFNAILANDLVRANGRPEGAPDRRALPIAGDDANAKRIVAALVEEFGFDAVDAGSLADSWRFERAKPAYCIPLDKAGLQGALAAAERDVELPHGSWRR